MNNYDTEIIVEVMKYLNQTSEYVLEGLRNDNSETSKLY